MAKDIKKIEEMLRQARQKEERLQARARLPKEEQIEQFIAGQLTENPRPMSREFQIYLAEYLPGKRITSLLGPLVIGGVLALAIFPLWDEIGTKESTTFGVIIFAAGLVGLPLAFTLYGIIKRRRALPRYSQVLTEGKVSSAEVVSVAGGKHFSKGGHSGVTQTIVQLRLNDELITLKTFDHDMRVALKITPRVAAKSAPPI